jgi:glutamate synthase (NADPH/NADH) small chain
VEFLRTELEAPDSRSGGVKTLAGSNFVIAADMVVKALGQEPLIDLVSVLPELKCGQGKIVVGPTTGATSIAGLYAGGDCLRNGGEIVDAVQDGKIAARGIHNALARA